MDISSTVKELISYHSGVKADKLSERDYIEEDLGTTGDDAWELMEDIREKCGVDLIDFDFTLHFGPEAGGKLRRDFGYYPVSVIHLITVVEKQKWIMPERNEENYAQVQNSQKKWLRIKIGLFFAVVVLGWLWGT